MKGEKIEQLNPNKQHIVTNVYQFYSLKKKKKVSILTGHLTNICLDKFKTWHFAHLPQQFADDEPATISTTR